MLPQKYHKIPCLRSDIEDDRLRKLTFHESFLLSAFQIQYMPELIPQICN